jgi:hypothetical protein
MAQRAAFCLGWDAERMEVEVHADRLCEIAMGQWGFGARFSSQWIDIGDHDRIGDKKY